MAVVFLDGHSGLCVPFPASDDKEIGNKTRGVFRRHFYPPCFERVYRGECDSHSTLNDKLPCLNECSSSLAFQHSRSDLGGVCDFVQLERFAYCTSLNDFSLQVLAKLISDCLVCI